MRKIYFRLSGNLKRESFKKDNAFLCSRHRVNVNSTYYGNNDFITEFRIPVDFFKLHFKFDRLSGIYRTKLTYGDLWEFMNVECLDL